MRRSVHPLLGVAVLAACASRPVRPPERTLFTLETSGLAEGAVAGRFAEATAVAAPSSLPPGGLDPGLAYLTRLRLVRPDGTVLTAPHLTAFAGQQATIQIVNQSAYVMDVDVGRSADAVIVDPVIGMLHEGTSIDLLAVPVPGRVAEAALGVRVSSAAARRPHGTREVALTTSEAPVTIETPRVETVEIAGAHRVRLGEETEWARIPDPAGGADLVVTGRIDAVRIDTPPEEEARAAEASSAAFLGEGARVASGPGAPGTFIARAVDLRPLADAAAAGAAQGVLRVTAVRLPAGVSDLAASSVERVGTLALRTVRSPGVRAADLLSAAYVGDFESEIHSHLPPDPVVATATSGLAAEVGGDGAVRLQWTTIHAWDSFRTTLSQGPPIEIDLPDAATATRTAPSAPGRTVHRMFTLPDGGTAAIVVEWEPDQPR